MCDYVLTAVAALLIVAVPVADLFLPMNIHIAHVLVVPVALVAAFAGPLRGALTALLAVLALIAAAVERDALTTENVLVQLASLVLVSVLLVVFALSSERGRHELAGERRISEAAQRVVLRPLPGRSGPLTIASAYRSADDGARVGGDLYAVARTANATRLLIGDVRGKGLNSLGETETVLGAFRAAAHRQEPLPELVASLEGSVRWGLAEFCDTPAEADVGERFVTAAVVEIPDDEPFVHVVSCGHLPPLLLHEGRATLLDVAEPAPPLGLGALAESTYAPSTFPFVGGDQLLLYTDGLTEARDAEGGFYPLVERAAGLTGSCPATLVQEVTRDLLGHAHGPLGDDMAVVALRREH
ncbi:PP2C family protein-serine/threonine phosphatase [Streptomyces sp. NPDC088354]|uniref:PP2C family protein-serine/threonine phosphatase n=1 Tax=unclassified Streptomyces TaxID=2593676 RepID=UPI0029A7C8C0|nr:PP2C family protein-serine/threonine phosphatase [Streptomyces sp. MI02-7b]MDX3076881.1 PP2C family protein-serine/threonine phosphatase [Streptomyces sp. MI02-7b]